MFHFLPNDFASSSFYLFCPLNFWWFSWYTEPLCCFSGFVFWLSPLSVPLKTPWRSVRKSFIVFTAMPLSSRCNPQLSALHAVQQNRCLGFFFMITSLIFPRFLDFLYVWVVNVVLCTVQEHILMSLDAFAFCISSLAVSACVTY